MIDFYEFYEGIVESNYKILLSAENEQGELCEIIELPMTAKEVNGLDYKGSYLNYYVGNASVLVSVYKALNDTAAVKLLASLYPDKKSFQLMSLLFINTAACFIALPGNSQVQHHN